jgi:hypothetical protein
MPACVPPVVRGPHVEKRCPRPLGYRDWQLDIRVYYSETKMNMKADVIRLTASDIFSHVCRSCSLYIVRTGLLYFRTCPSSDTLKHKVSESRSVSVLM